MRSSTCRNFLLLFTLFSSLMILQACINEEGSAAEETTVQEDELILTGIRIYAMSCASCHGDARTGAGAVAPSPPLESIGRTLTDEELQHVIRSGRGIMPPFRDLDQEEIRGLILYLTAENLPDASAAATFY